MGQEALLAALAEWVRAEAADVRIATPRTNGAAAKRYVAMLGEWAGRIGGTQRWAIPRVSKGLRQAARAVSEEREQRFDLAVQLYRRELNKKGAVVRRDSRRARTDVERACAVRGAAMPSSRSMWPRPVFAVAAFLLTVLATPFSCLPQAVGLAVYASHEEQVDVMLAAIADGRRERVAASAAWAKGPVGQRLTEYEEEWKAFRCAEFVAVNKDRAGRPDVFRVAGRRQSGDGAAADTALVAALGIVHSQLKRIVSARERVAHFNKLPDRLGMPPLSQREASRVAREACRDADLERLPPWRRGGQCPCLPHESCGRGCPNYALGAQAAW